MVKCDVVTLDSALDNSISKHLLDGNSLNLTYSTFVFQEQELASATFNVNVNRSVTQLRSVFINFVRKMEDITYGDWVYKPVNLFYHPMLLPSSATELSISGEYNSEKEYELQLQLGSSLYPEYPIRSSAESFYNLKKGLAIVASPLHGFYMDPRMYRSTHFACCFDLEKVLDANFTGISTRSGQLLTVRGKPYGSGITNLNRPEKIHIILYCQYNLEINASGVTVYD